MGDFVIYHNPRCSKSRQTLSLLEDQGITPRIVEYLKSPPSEAALKKIIQKLGCAPRDLVRTGEVEFRELVLDLSDDAAVISALVAHPKLIERPIFVSGDRAVIGRPPENVKDLM